MYENLGCCCDTSGLIQWASDYIEDDLSARMAVRMVVSCAAFLPVCVPVMLGHWLRGA